MKKLLLSLAAVAAVGGGAAVWFSHRNTALSEKPAPLTAGANVAPPASTSTVGVDVQVAYAAIAAQVNQLPITSISKSDTGTLRKRLPGFRTDFPPIDIPGPVVSVDYKWEFTARKDGPITVQRHGDRLRLALPISFDGHAGFRGDLAHFMSIDRKSFAGSLTAYVDLAFDLNEDWEPKVDANVSFDWRNKARLEIVGGVWVPIADLLNGPLDDAMKQAAREANKAIRAEAIRNAVTPVWKRHDVALGTVGRHPADLTLTPREVAFSGVRLQERSLSFAVTAKFDSLVRWPSVAEPAPTLTLPRLQRTAFGPGRMNLSLPIAADYAALQQTLSAELTGREWQGDTPLGAGRVVVKEITVYPAADGALAIGARIDAKFAHRFFNVGGWIYLQAKPTLASAEQSLRLRDVKFSRALDNQLWNAATALLARPLEEAIAQKATVDLRPSIADLKLKVAAGLANPTLTHGLRVNFNPDFIGLRDVRVGAESLVATVGLESNASVVLDTALAVR